MLHMDDSFCTKNTGDLHKRNQGLETNLSFSFPQTMHEECAGPVALFTEPCMKSADPSSINTGFLPLKRYKGHLKHLGGKKGPEQQNNPTARS